MSVLPTLRLLRDVALALCLAWILGLGMATQPLAQTPAVETTSTPVSDGPLALLFSSIPIGGSESF